MEAKYDIQSQQEAKMGGLVIILCMWRNKKYYPKNVSALQDKNGL